MAAKRDFKSATESCTVNGRDDRLGRLLYHVNDVAQIWQQWRLVKFPHIRACNESLALAGNDDGMHISIGNGGLDSIQQTRSNRLADGIDRWVVDRNQCDFALLAQGYGHGL